VSPGRGVRLGLFGGSFDPIHFGHILPVREARRRLELERVVYLPTALPPHKPGREFAPAHARYAMVELALLREEGLEASPLELTLERPAYTVETLERLRRQHDGAELHLLIGGDSFAELPQWLRWEEIPALARVVVLARPGWKLAAALEQAPAPLRRAEAEGRVILLDTSPVPVSSTDLRARLARGEAPPAGWVPDLVLEYIRKYDLYR
jgi:nicotinate-nucleotide adenylyltransferase